MPSRHTVRNALLTLPVVAIAVLTAVAVPQAAARTAHQPYGGLTALYGVGDGFRIAGWAYDPDTRGPATVFVQVDGARKARLLANQPRASRGVDANRGFSAIERIPAGTHRICARVADYPSLSQILTISCRTLTLNYNPIGALPKLTQAPGTLTASGWALDQSRPVQAARIVVRVDGAPVAYAFANRPYAGLHAKYPVAGDNHGFSVTFPIAEGVHRVCLKAFNLGDGSDAIVQCYTNWRVNFSPTGGITGLVQTPGGLRIAGWASDPDTTAATTVTVTANGTTLGTLPANGAGGPHSGHAFLGTVAIPGTLTPGPRSVCVIARNLGTYGKNSTVQCLSRSFNWNPTGTLETLTQQGSGAAVSGWATDPDQAAPISVRITGDGKTLATVPASGAKGSHPGHMFSTHVTLTDGKHTVCAVAVNVKYGSGDGTPNCRTVTLNFTPYGTYESVGRATSTPDILASGWAIDPDSTGPIPVQVLVDGTMTQATANKPHSGAANGHGFTVDIPAATTDGEHRVCVNAVNVGGGTKPLVSLGCKTVNAVHPLAPTAPRNVSAVGGYGGAQIVWAAPTSDGGAPWTGYTVRALPNGPTVNVAAGVLSATVYGLTPSTKYTFSVTATNVAGVSPAAVSPAVTTQKQPPPQTSPAPISTSRYIRNVSGSSAADLARMRAEGAADARANPSGHGYLIVLAIGGQDESRQGVILSATIRFVTYASMVKNLQAYVDGYASQQRPSAPITIAIATNNDVDVYRASGVNFANRVIDPVQSYARRYPGITIAGSDDMEPGFRASYASSRAWLQGYLAATTAPFVFTGSADGCSPYTSNSSCNNGWSMAGLYYLTGGAYPVRMINLPQIYNTAMAQQWRYISLTGVRAGQPKINFGGALTEWTACQQARSCGSLTGNTAWLAMWNQLRAEPALRPTSLPYSTDLRIDS